MLCVFQKSPHELLPNLSAHARHEIDDVGLEITLVVAPLVLEEGVETDLGTSGVFVTGADILAEGVEFAGFVG